MEGNLKTQDLVNQELTMGGGHSDRENSAESFMNLFKEDMPWENI